MKRYYISAILIALTVLTQAQNNTAPRVSRGADRNAQQATDKKTGLPELSVRAQNMNEQLTQEIGHARWIRNILRELDLTKEKNAPLYYPVQETNGNKNLFTTLFHLLSEDKIKVYRYLIDQEESFEEDNILPFKEMLDNFKILYDEIPAGGGRPVAYAINASDIPSGEVRQLYVKEAWYFDQNNSICDVKTLAICPIATVTLEGGGVIPQAMFWVKYEDIRPYIKNNYIMTSSINNARTYTMDDFFRRRLYDGEIIQTENLLNLPLAKLFDTDEELYVEQQRIENQLKSFNDSLWIKPDTATVTLSKKEIKKSSASSRGSSSSEVKSSTKPTKEKAPKQPKAPAEKAAKTSPSRSIRR